MKIKQIGADPYEWSKLVSGDVIKSKNDDDNIDYLMLVRDGAEYRFFNLELNTLLNVKATSPHKLMSYYSEVLDDYVVIPKDKMEVGIYE